MSAYQAPVDPTNVGGKRIVSAIIDVGIAWVIYYVLFAALSKPNETVIIQPFGTSDGCAGEPFCSNINGRHVSGGSTLLLFAIFWGYMIGVFVIQRGLTGKTLGTMAMGVVTVSEQGTPLGIPKALGRSAAGIVDYLPCCLPLVGIITIFATKGHRRVGDMAVKSFVVDKQWAGQPILVAGVSAAAAGPYAQPYAQPGYGAPVQPYGQPGSAPPPQPGYSQPGYAPPQPGFAPAPPPMPPAQPMYGAPEPGAAPVTPPTEADPFSGTPSPWPVAEQPAPTEPPAWGSPAFSSPPASPPPTAPETPPTSAAWEPPVVVPEPIVPEPVVAEPVPTAAPASDPTQPQWDTARNAYIQWDPTGQVWLQFNDATQQWGPIS